MYYVYILAQPNNKPFYVGKGEGNRVHQHEKEAERGCGCPKCETIRRIWKRGGQVCKYIVFTTEVPAEAYAYEAELIALIGRENLTNLTDGGAGVRGLDPRSIEAARRSRALRMEQKAAEAERWRDKWNNYWRRHDQDRRDALQERQLRAKAEEAQRAEAHRIFHETHELRWVLYRTLTHINHARVQSGEPPITPSFIADRAQVSLDYLASLLSGTAKTIRGHECGRICRLLGIGIDDLIAYVPKG